MYVCSCACVCVYQSVCRVYLPVYLSSHPSTTHPPPTDRVIIEITIFSGDAATVI